MSYIGQKPADKLVTSSDMEDDIVTSAKIVDATIVTADVADDAITLAKMASGTDGNIISYDTSGNPVAVATGSSGQVLTSAGAGAIPSFQTASGGTVLQVKSIQTGDFFSTTSTGLGASAFDVSGLGTTFTPTASSSHIIITGMIHMTHINSLTARGFITYNHSGISETVIKSSKSSSSYNSTFKGENSSNSTENTSTPLSINLHLSPNTTNEITFKTRVMTSGSSYATTINNNVGELTNSDDGSYVISSLTFWEISGDISPSLTNSVIDT